MDFIITNCPQIVVCIVICLAKIIEISIQSVRVVFLVKGEKVKATLLAFIECLLWGIVISAILTSLGDNFYWLIAYCLGFALGIFVGSIIENKIALGTCNIQIVAKQIKTDIILHYLQEQGKGYTLVNGEGSKEKMSVIFVILPRKEVKKLVKDIRSICENDVFVVHSDVSKSIGGFGLKK